MDILFLFLPAAIVFANYLFAGVQPVAEPARAPRRTR